MARVDWSPNKLRWEIAEPFDGADTLGRAISAGPLVAQVLHIELNDDLFAQLDAAAVRVRKQTKDGKKLEENR